MMKYAALQKRAGSSSFSPPYQPTRKPVTSDSPSRRSGGRYKLKQVGVLFSPEVIDQLETLALKTHTDVSHLVRIAVASMLASVKKNRGQLILPVPNGIPEPDDTEQN